MTIKTKLLFVIYNMGSGGAERSLVSLLSLLDYDLYEVDLFLFRKDGMFLSQIPEQVNAVMCENDYSYFDGPYGRAIGHFLLEGRPDLVVARTKYAKVFRNPDDNKPMRAWKQMSKCFSPLKKRYDVVIGYLEGVSNYFCADKVAAKKYIAYIHTDYSINNALKNVDDVYLGRFDKIVTVSEKCKSALNDYFPLYRDKLAVIENISSKKNIMSMAEKETVLQKKSGELVLLTIGRFYAQKGLDIAVDTCAELKRRGLNFKWYHIGTGGVLKPDIERQCAENQVENCFIMLGEKENPYPYIKACDIYVQPSRFEGKSIAIDEAKLLEKPILVTNYPTAVDQIEDGVTGIIADMNSASIADKIELMAADKAMCEKLSNNLKGYVGNESELQKFYDMIKEV